MERQGSYALGTLIKRVGDNDEYDADIQIVMNPNAKWQAKDYIKEVHGTLKQNENYADKLRLKTRCVTVDYAGDFHLDVVPRAPLVDEEALTSLPHCPAMRHGYQLFRQQALAEGTAQSGRYDLVVSAVAVDGRNDALDAALSRSGIDGLKRWGTVFKGSAQFAVFTHQQWVGWVQEHDTEGKWSDWLSYVRSRYGLGG